MDKRDKENIHDFTIAVCKDLMGNDYDSLHIEDAMYCYEALLLKGTKVSKSKLSKVTAQLLVSTLSRWALAILGREYGNINYEYWKKDIVEHLECIREIELASGDKLEVLRHYLIEKKKIKDIKEVAHVAYHNEQITEDKWATRATEEISNEIDDIINVMAGYVETPSELVNRIFPRKDTDLFGDVKN